MSDIVIENWLKSSKAAQIEGFYFHPQQHFGIPLAAQRGQATVFYLQERSKKLWALKKFSRAKKPSSAYISAVQALVPTVSGCESGFQRKILSRESLIASANGNYYADDLAVWLKDTVLMPYVVGASWADMADDIRKGQCIPQKNQRLKLCKSLITLLGALEEAEISHRDLSSENILVDVDWNVHLIDWDSLYHGSLIMPTNTTFGSEGYIATFVNQDIRKTWCKYADRFSVAVFIMEFLTIRQNSPLTGNGGMFEQNEIDARSGYGMDKILSGIDKDCTQARLLFRQALQAISFEHMPSPQEWKQSLPSWANTTVVSPARIAPPIKKPPTSHKSTRTRSPSIKTPTRPSHRVSSSDIFPQKTAELLAILAGLVLSWLIGTPITLPSPFLGIVLFIIPFLGFALSERFRPHWVAKLLLYYGIFYGLAFVSRTLGYMTFAYFVSCANSWIGSLLAGVNIVYFARKLLK